MLGISTTGEGRVKHPGNFHERPLVEQEFILRDSWCARCNKGDLGMVSPREYEEEGRTFVEGRCAKCGFPIRTEVSTFESPGP